MIDLHLHTTASDGRLTPPQLVAAAAAAGLRVMAVTDHDTTAAVREVEVLAAAQGIQAVAGIEITAIDHGAEVHVLGYFVRPADRSLEAFLARQRGARVARVQAIGERLSSLGMPVDLAPLLAETRAQAGRSIGRPQIARAMVAAGHVADTREAFDRWLGHGLPAFVAREGATAEEVISVVHAAGGLVSIAHPGSRNVRASDERLAALRDAGLDAIEAYHCDHDASVVAHYVSLADALGLLRTGGSDFHGDPAHGRSPGSVTLPAADFDRLVAASDAR